MLARGEVRVMKIIVSSGTESGRVVEVDRELTIGRAQPADILLSDPRVSGRHAVLRPTAGGLIIEDLGSSNGTLVDGMRITGPRELRGGEAIRVGDTTLQVTAPPTVQAATAPPWQLTVRTGPDAGASAMLAAGATVLIGRDPTAQLVLTDSRVSNQHASVTLDGGVVTVRDLGSANGTLLNGTPVRGRVPVPPKAEIQVGESVLVATAGALTGSGPTPTVIGRLPGEVTAAPRRTSTKIIAGAGVLGAAAAAVIAAVTLRSGDATLTPAQVVSANKNATVLILNSQGGQLNSKGSGFVIDAAKGLIVTNNHVASGGDLAVQAESARDTRVPAKLVAAMPCEDLALVKIDDPKVLKSITQVTYATTSFVQGDPVVALGYPGSAESGREFATDSLSATSGIVSKVEARYDVPFSGVPLLTSVVQHSAAVNPGNSGGPLFDDRGHLIGVNTAIFFGAASRAENESYAISIKRLRERVAALEAGKSLHWTGIALGDTLQTEAGERFAVRVGGITPGSPADKAGVPTDAAIALIDGKPVRDTQEYCDAVPETEGATVDLGLLVPGVSELQHYTVKVGNDG